MARGTSKRNKGRSFWPRDADGTPHAAAFVVWDTLLPRTICLSGADPDLRKQGGQYFLLWEIVKKMAKKVNRFDFEGSMVPGIESVFRSFGGQQVPYLRVRRFGSRLWEILSWIKGSV